MLFLEILSETYSWRDLLQDINLASQVVGVILIVIYVIYTYKTFVQIKKQTDYQQDAFIKVETLISKDITDIRSKIQMIGSTPVIVPRQPGITEKYLQKDISLKMKGILQPIFNLDNNLFEGNYFVVILTNYGSTEVNQINLKLNVVINNSKELVEKKMLRESETYLKDIVITEIIARNGGQLKMPLVSTAAFPIYRISITGTYTDVRNKLYNISPVKLIGENEHFHRIQ
jgi:hypothetical protein